MYSLVNFHKLNTAMHSALEQEIKMANAAETPH